MPSRPLQNLLVSAHRAKGIRYPTPSSQKDCFKTWYSYAIRRGETEGKPMPMPKERKDRAGRERDMGGRTYL
ncbi:hypothetical protein B0J11DRAFT_448618 [Dendryphion nanum]|uniref:Uncharacterized protein n=1 Tax=Dendryphion nanum TaxID=256645 RepID=A0A9P9CZB3_9PLEO|nr:hypothetical protein B0J11DRAFT_448618 [Dendryphion nanum]